MRAAPGRPSALPFLAAMALAAVPWSAVAHAQADAPEGAARAPEGAVAGLEAAAPAPVLTSQLAPVLVTGRHDDNGVGTSDAASQGAVGAERLKARPARRPGEVLESVPGMVVTQHSGDGKANQYFLRGFNLDHGTDFATSVDGVPVNLPTHGHGQGYADLNFLIPELVERIEYRKGPYFARDGDFAAAGAADIAYRRTLDAPFAAVTLGTDRHRRLVGGASAQLGTGLRVLGALELARHDGPWTVPQGLRRTNGVLSVAGGTRAEGWHASLMTHDARWTATDQVPQRLLDAGTFAGRPFGRFDSLDPTDGGATRRTSLSGAWHRRGDTASTQLSAYALAYRLSLFSNFTYALERPDEGDQFAQRDRRRAFGLGARHAFDHRWGALPARSEFGAGVRHDRIRVGLDDTVARRVVRTTRDDRVRTTLLGVHAQTAVELAPSLRAVAGVRADHARFEVEGLAQPANGGRSSDTLVSPKLSLVWGPWRRTELFLNAGRGLHSNDARGTTATRDPRSGEPVDRVRPLVAARGLEAGLRTEWIPGLQSSLSLWRLDSASELVYVGDAGSTEARRGSRRHGIEWSNRWSPRPWLTVDADLAWTHARFAGAGPAGDRIPNTVDRVASLGVTVRERGPWSASLQWRYLGSGALVEDDSVRSRPSLTANLRVSRALGRASELAVDVFNLFDRRVDDIAYLYESRLPGEAAPVLDRHVHPAEPRSVRITLQVGF